MDVVVAVQDVADNLACKAHGRPHGTAGPDQAAAAGLSAQPDMSCTRQMVVDVMMVSM